MWTLDTYIIIYLYHPHTDQSLDIFRLKSKILMSLFFTDIYLILLPLISLKLYATLKQHMTC